MPRRGTVVAGLTAFLISATACWGADIRGRSSTQLFWYDDYLTGRQAELAQYMRIGVTNIDKEKRMSVYGYGRGSQDFTGGDGLSGRLYYLYGEYRDIYDTLDLRLGRQFVNLSAGSAIIDGGQVDVKGIGPVLLTVMGGRDVIFGANTELGPPRIVFGTSIALAGFRNTDLDFSWLAKWRDGDARDLYGASFKQYLFDSIKLYGNAQYDSVGTVFNQALAGVKYFPTANTILTGEYYQSYPVFDTDSIYSVFAVNRYQEGVLRADYTINEQVSVNAGYNRQDYGDDAQADVFQLGCTIRPTSKLTVDLAYDHRNGYGGGHNGGLVDVTWDATTALQLSGGLAVDAYDRSFFPSSSGNETAQRYWLGGRYRLAKSMSASLRLEENINASYASNLNGRFIFNYDF